MKTVKTDVCVIGGGVMGLSCAYYLTRKNKSVILLERTDIGSGASGACDDMILLQSKNPGVTLNLAMESLEMYRALPSELGVDIGVKTSGGTVLIEDDKQLSVMESFVKRQKECGLQVEIIGKADLKKKHPHVSDAIIASTYSPSDSQVDPLRLMRSFLNKSTEKGLVVYRGAEVKAIKSNGSYWQVSFGEDVTVECSYVVNAAGAWAAEIGALVNIDIPITPRKGQIAITEQISPIGETNVWSAAYIASKLDKSLLPDKGAYAKEIGLGFSFSQTCDGNYLIGSTREDIGFSKSTDAKAIATIVSQARSYFPILNHVNIIRTIAGLRPACKDGTPIVGAVDELPGFYIAAGHEGDGIAMAPITGTAIADMICHGREDESFQKLNFRRFKKEVDNQK